MATYSFTNYLLSTYCSKYQRWTLKIPRPYQTNTGVDREKNSPVKQVFQISSEGDKENQLDAEVERREILAKDPAPEAHIAVK